MTTGNDRDQGFYDDIAAIFERARAKRAADRVEPDDPRACQRCHEFIGKRCSVCDDVVCGYNRCHIVYHEHGGHVPFVMTDPVTNEVVPRDLQEGWKAVKRECPTCSLKVRSGSRDRNSV